MAVAFGNDISYSNYKGTYSGSWRPSYGRKINIGTSSIVLYVACPCFYISYHINHTGLGTSSGRFTLYKWDGYSTSFSNAFLDRSFSKGIFSDDEYCVFVHNKDNESYNYHDNSNIHLWKITASGGISGSGGTDCDITIYSGGIEVIPNNSTYNYMWKSGSELSSCAIKIYGQEGNAHDASILQLIEYYRNNMAVFGNPEQIISALESQLISRICDGEYANDASFIRANRPSAFTGTQISTSNAIQSYSK